MMQILKETPEKFQYYEQYAEAQDYDLIVGLQQNLCDALEAKTLIVRLALLQKGSVMRNNQAFYTKLGRQRRRYSTLIFRTMKDFASVRTKPSKKEV